jgi:RNA polymerase sigma factor (sigma-70 family)
MKLTSVTSQHENQWIDMARAGDLVAFNQLVLAYQDAAFRMARWMLSDEDAAEDITQTVFIAAYRSICSFHGSSFRAWVMRMVHNACIDELRRRKRHAWLTLEAQNENGEEMETARWLVDPGLDPEEAIVQAEAWEHLQACVRGLPEAMREVAALIDIEGFDYSEVATTLGVPLGTVKSRIGRARAQLRAALREEYGARFIPAAEPLDLLYTP